MLAQFESGAHISLVEAARFQSDIHGFVSHLPHAKQGIWRIHVGLCEGHAAEANQQKRHYAFNHWCSHNYIILGKPTFERANIRFFNSLGKFLLL